MTDQPPKKEDPKKEETAAPGQPAGVTPANEPIKDKPRPFSIYRDEAAKTTAVQQTVAAERKVVDDKFNKLNEAYAPALADYDKQLKAAADERLSVRRETVENLSKEVGSVENSIAELQKKLKEEREKLYRSQDSLSTAQKDLGSETSKIAKEQRVSRNEKVKALSTDISAARKERKEVYSKTRKELRREHWNTFKRTTKESVAFIPDMTVRAVNALRSGFGEVLSVFNKSAKKAQEGFEQPTPFSIKREQPLTPPRKPEAPKAA